MTNQLYSAQELRKLYSLDTVFQVGFQVDLKIKHLDGALNKYQLTHLQFEVLLDSLHKAIGVAQILEMLFKVTIVIKKSSARVGNLLFRVPINMFNQHAKLIFPI